MFSNVLLFSNIKRAERLARSVQTRCSSVLQCIRWRQNKNSESKHISNLKCFQYENIFIFNNNISTRNNSNDDCEEKSFVSTEADFDGTSFELKSLLYKDSDELIRRINMCRNQEELLKIITGEDDLKLQHRVQCVIVLWALHQEANEKKLKIDDKILKAILSGLQQHLPELNINELSFCYLYLRKMNVPNTDTVVRDLLLNALKKMGNIDLVPLTTLSRLSIAINAGHNFYTPMVCANFVPHIMVHLNSSYNHESIRLIAICMFNIHQIVDDDMLSMLKERVQELLDNNILNSETTKAIMKLLQLLNLPTWSQQNAKIIRNLLLALRQGINDFNEVETKTICRIFQHHLEPAALEHTLKTTIEQQLKQQPAVDTLACFMPFVEPTKRGSLIRLFKQLLKSSEQWQTPHADVNFFNILRALKISESKLCDAYWESILKSLQNVYSEEQTKQRMLRHCHRYMHFNNNLGGTYRYLPLEQKITQFAMHAMENSLMGNIPWKFARLAAFVMAYGHTPYSWKKFPNTLLSKIISMGNQFSPTDCFYISRGLQICLEMRFHFYVPTTLNMQLNTIDSILSTSLERHLQNNENIFIQDLNTIVRTLNSRKSLKNSLIYQQVMNKYKTSDYSNLNSRTIRDLAYIFTASNYVEPKALDAMFDYIKNNHAHILGDSVEKVLTCAYTLGYTPDSLDVFEYAAQVILRDFDFMSGLSIVQACLALCFYKMMPEDLINKIFCVNFIKRIEDEIHLCYSKATYPDRVLNLVMQLNRTVCLDFPEANVPWFQQNFVEAQLSKKLFVRNRFSDEIKSLLFSILKDEIYFRCNHTTPYGYQIDFVIHFDKDRKPIPMPAETAMLDRITKVAILLLKLDSFCENDLSALRGPDSLKTKHLEMMGYKVLHINEHDWNSKYMNAPDAKVNYLKCLLQITS